MAPKWKELSVKFRPDILKALEDGGFESPTIVQARAIPLFMKNKDVAVEAITGSGKTLAFVVPILEIMLRRTDPWKKHEIGAVVVSPTRELATQTWQVLEHFLSGPHALPGVKLKSILVVGGSDPSEDVRKFEADGANILIATPGRLEDLLAKKTPGSNFASHVRSLEIVVLDEADKLLEFGFERTITTILSYFPKQRRTGLFSATQSEALNPLLKTGMRNPVNVTVRDVQAKKDFLSTPGSLENFYMICEEKSKFDNLVAMLQTPECRDGKVLVFFATCACVDYFSSALKAVLGSSTPVLSLHGKMKAKRNKIFQRFKEMETGILISTDVMARGIDIPDIEWVIQYDPPSSAPAFVHRCGRTARNGQPGKALLMLLKEEEPYVKFLSLNQKVHLEKMQTFAEPTADGDDKESLPALEALRQVLTKDHGLIDKSARAFVSFIQFYIKHECSVIFQLKNLNLGRLAAGFALLKLPKMPELKKLDASDFAPTQLDVNRVPYKDKQKEKQRQGKLKVFKETGVWPLSRTKLKEKERFAEMKRLREERKRERVLESKRRKTQAKIAKMQKFTRDDIHELEEDVRLIRKLKKGRISKDQFDKAFCAEKA